MKQLHKTPSLKNHTGTEESCAFMQNRILVVYSVGYPPVDKVKALQKYVLAVAPGVYQINPVPKQDVTGNRVPPAAPRGLPSAFAGRKLLAEEGRQGRQLLQYPYNNGAWNSVSFGIRLAYIDLDTLLQPVVSNPPTIG